MKTKKLAVAIRKTHLHFRHRVSGFTLKRIEWLQGFNIVHSKPFARLFPIIHMPWAGITLCHNTPVNEEKKEVKEY